MLLWIIRKMTPRNCCLFPPCSSGILRRFHTSKGRLASGRNYYDILGVSRTATTAEIKKAFVKLSKEYHPDVNKTKEAHDRFVEINEAYSVLSKEDSRWQYDAKLQQGQSFDDYGPPPPHHNSSREAFRRYYEEMYRQEQRARTPPEDPFRDFWQDYRFTEKQQSTSPFGGRKVRLDEQANRAFYYFLVATLTLGIMVHWLQYTLIREKSRRLYEYEDIDERLGERRRDAIIVDRSDQQSNHKQPSSSPSSSQDQSSSGGGRFVDA